MNKSTFLVSVFLFCVGGIGLCVWFAMAESDIAIVKHEMTKSKPAKVNILANRYSLECDYYRAMNKLYWASMDENMWDNKRFAIVKDAYNDLKRISLWAPGYKKTMSTLKHLEKKEAQEY